MTNMGTRIVEHRGRVQPYTVWVRSQVVAFCETRQEAHRILTVQQSRKHV